MKLIKLFSIQLLSILIVGITPAKAQQKDNNTSEKSCFYNAEASIDSMLSGKVEPNYEKAVFLTENAYWGNRDRYSTFDSLIGYNIQKIESIANDIRVSDTSKVHMKYYTDSREKKGIEHEKLQRDYAIYKYMASANLFEYQSIMEYHAPYDYCSKDPYGTLAWKNSQVSNLITEHEGNCYAMASLFKIFSDKLHTDAVIATTPGHAFIQHNNDDGVTFNVELAAHAFPGSGSIETLTYTTEKAIKTGIAMRSLNNIQSINLCLIYLAKGYENKFHSKNDDFLIDCAETALEYDSLNLNAMLLKAEVLESRLLDKHLPIAALRNDKTFSQYEKLIQNLFNLGYREMPVEMQNIVLANLKKEDYGTLANHTPQPFADLKVNNAKYATVSGGLFDEEIHDKPIERYHRTLFDTKTERIASFTSIDSTYDNYVTDPVVFAWSIDPLCTAYPAVSPYAAFDNNPIYYIDPDGQIIKPSNAEGENAVAALINSFADGLKNDNTVIQLFGLDVTKEFKGQNFTTTLNYTEKQFVKHAERLGLSEKEAKRASTLFKVIQAQDVYEVAVVEEGGITQVDLGYSVLTQSTPLEQYFKAHDPSKGKPAATQGDVNTLLSKADVPGDYFGYFKNTGKTPVAGLLLINPQYHKLSIPQDASEDQIKQTNKKNKDNLSAASTRTLEESLPSIPTPKDNDKK